MNEIEFGKALCAVVEKDPFLPVTINRGVYIGTDIKGYKLSPGDICTASEGGDNYSEIRGIVVYSEIDYQYCLITLEGDIFPLRELEKISYLYPINVDNACLPNGKSWSPLYNKIISQQLI